MTINDLLNLELSNASIPIINTFLEEKKGVDQKAYFQARIFLLRVIKRNSGIDEYYKSLVSLFHEKDLIHYNTMYLFLIDELIKISMKLTYYKEALFYIKKKRDADATYMYELDLIKIYMVLELYLEAQALISSLDETLLSEEVKTVLKRDFIYIAIGNSDYKTARELLDELLSETEATFEDMYLNLLISLSEGNDILSDIKKLKDLEIPYSIAIKLALLEIEALITLGKEAEAISIYKENVEFILSQPPLLRKKFFLVIKKANLEDSFLKGIDFLLEKASEEIVIQQDVSFEIVEEKERKEINLNEKIEELYGLINQISLSINDFSNVNFDQDLREILRLTLIFINKIVPFSEAVISIKEKEAFLLDFKKERIYERTRDQSVLKNTIFEYLYSHNEEIVKTDNKDMITDIEVISQKKVYETNILEMFGLPLSSSVAISFYFTTKALSSGYNYEALIIFSRIVFEKILIKKLIDTRLVDYAITNSIIKNNPLGIMYLKDNTLTLNKKATDIFGLEPITNINTFIKLLDDENKVNYREIIRQLKKGIISESYIIYKIDKLIIKELLRLERTKVGPIIISLLIDITKEQEELNYQELMANYSFITKLKNRKSLVSDLVDYIALNKFSILLIDIDSFKLYNDIFGHDFGDRTLKELALLLQTKYKAPDYELYHLESDEIVVIAKKQNDQRAINNLAQEIIETIEFDLLRVDIKMKISVSIGILRYPIHTVDKNPNKLIKYTQMALYGAKKNKEFKKSSFYQYSKEDYRNDLFEQILVTHVSEAIDHNLLTVKYQQVVDIKNNKVLHYEAKTNIINYSVTDKYVSDIAIKRNIISSIDTYLIRTTIKEIKEIFKETNAYIKASIPVNEKTFSNPSFVDFLKKELKKYDIKPNIFNLEITGEINDYIDARKKINMIRSLGVTVSITEISDLVKLDVDYIKISKTTDSLNEVYTLKALEEINRMASSLDVQLIVNEVSLLEQLELLRKTSISYIEGPIFGKRISKDDILKKMVKKHEEV